MVKQLPFYILHEAKNNGWGDALLSKAYQLSDIYS